MPLPDISGLLTNQWVTSGLSAVGGALISRAVSVYRERIKVIEYSVAYERVGISNQDAIFGVVQVTWEGHPVTNLHVCRATVENTTSADYTNIHFRVYTGTTLLLNQRVELIGSPHVPAFTPDFAASVAVPAGGVPTDDQINIYRHNREYRIPVFNRGQRLIVTFLTTVPDANDQPWIFVDLMHPGVRIEYRPPSQEIHGVPVPLALPIGVLGGLALLIVVSVFANQPWVAAAISFVVGLFAQSIGAGLYRVFRFFRRWFLG